MTVTDNELFEAYKKLDKLLKDMYGTDDRSKGGVTCYIDEMLKTRLYGYGIVSWEDDLRQLKRVRHIRNKISHEPDCDGIAEPNDVLWTREFYDRVMRQDDPLSVIARVKREREQARKARSSETEAVPHYTSHYAKNEVRRNQRRKGCAITGIVLGLLFCCIVAYIIVVWMLFNNVI